MKTSRLIFLLITIGPSVLAGVVSAASPAMRFDGTGGILELRSAPALELRDEVTLEAWMCAERYEEPGVRLIDKSQAGSQSGYMLDTFPGNSLRLLLAEGLLTAKSVLKPGEWTHVAGVFSVPRGIYKLYVFHHAYEPNETCETSTPTAA